MGITAQEVYSVAVLSLVAYIGYQFANDFQPSTKPYTGEEINEATAPWVNDSGRLALNEIVSRTKAAYRENSGNEARQGEIRRVRGEAICKTFPTNKFRNWRAWVESYSTTSDGVDIRNVELSIGEDVTLEPKEGFKRGSPEHSLFLQGLGKYDDGLFTKTERHEVRITGRFLYDADKGVSDCFQERSLLLSSGMTSPSFAVDLTGMEWVRDAKATQ